MSPMLALLNQMRERLGMYLGKSSVIRLAAFLRGYEHAREELASNSTDHFLADLRDWLHHHYQTTQHSWEELLLQFSDNNEAEAVLNLAEVLSKGERVPCTDIVAKGWLSRSSTFAKNTPITSTVRIVCCSTRGTSNGTG